LSVAIVLSLLLSLTTTPCMCAHLLGNMRARAGSLVDRFLEFMERGFKAMLDFYAHTLRAALAHPRLVISILGATVALNFYLFAVIPKGFFPQEDTGVIQGMRRELSRLTGASLFLQVQQDIRAGGRQGNDEYQYTLLGDDLNELNTWAPKITEALKHVPELADVNSDQQ